MYHELSYSDKFFYEKYFFGVFYMWEKISQQRWWCAFSERMCSRVKAFLWVCVYLYFFKIPVQMFCFWSLQSDRVPCRAVILFFFRNIDLHSQVRLGARSCCTPHRSLRFVLHLISHLKSSCWTVRLKRVQVLQLQNKPEVALLKLVFTDSLSFYSIQTTQLGLKLTLCLSSVLQTWVFPSTDVSCSAGRLIAGSRSGSCESLLVSDFQIAMLLAWCMSTICCKFMGKNNSYIFYQCKKVLRQREMTARRGESWTWLGQRTEEASQHKKVLMEPESQQWIDRLSVNRTPTIVSQIPLFFSVKEGCADYSSAQKQLVFWYGEILEMRVKIYVF